MVGWYKKNIKGMGKEIEFILAEEDFMP